MKAILRGLVGCFVILAMSAAASAATVHIEGPTEVIVGPGVTVSVEFEIFVDTATILDADLFDYSLGVSGPGVAIDHAGTQNATDAGAALPAYIFSGDGDGTFAGQDFGGGGPASLYASDLSASGDGYAAAGKSLGTFVVKVTGGDADGLHVISGRGNSDVTGFDVGLIGATAEEGAMIPNFEFNVAVPEPATMSLLILGGLSILARRKRR